MPDRLSKTAAKIEIAFFLASHFQLMQFPRVCSGLTAIPPNIDGVSGLNTKPENTLDRQWPLLIENDFL